MAEVLSCPECQRKLQVPESLMGQDVQCPTCGATFQADTSKPVRPALDGSPPVVKPEPPLPESRQLDRPSGRHINDEDEDDLRERRPRRRRRRDYQPHRGGMIMAMGIISLFFMGYVLGPIAWIMGNSDLKEIRAGRMDPEGESATNTGRICGMIATILNIAMFILILVGMCLFFTLVIGSEAMQKGKKF
jgi:hypothetical protein